MAELNGVPVSVGEMQTLALTNYGHFTSMRVERNHVRGLSQHLYRLDHDSRILFGAALDLDRARSLIRQAVADAADEVVVRVTVFDPSLDLGHPGSSDDPQILVTTRTAGQLPLPPLRVKSAKYSRDVPSVKCVGLFGSIHHRRQAQLAGFDDALFVDDESAVSEGGTWNVGFYDGDQLIWPDAECLPGITMALINQVHEGPIVTAPMHLPDITNMQAAFATNAAIGVRAITTVDDIQLAKPAPIIDKLRSDYADIPAEAI